MNYEEVTKNFKFYRYNEDVFLESEKYLFIDKSNEKAYSFLFSNLLINICSDFESLCKKYFGITGSENITGLLNRLKADDNFNDFFAEEMSLMGTSYENLTPLHNDGSTFVWWSRYNDIKHDKLNNISVATQGTVINALAALYALNMYVLKRIAEIESKPDHFFDYTPIFSFSKLTTKTKSLGDLYLTTVKVEEED